MLDASEHTATRALDPVRPRRRWGLTAFLVALVLVAAGVGVYVMVNANRAETVAVPGVVDKLGDDAEEILLSAKLQVRRVEVNGPADTSVDRVTAQDPVAETPVLVGTEVTITVNIGPQMNTVPDLLGMDADDAEKELRDLSFTNIERLAAPTEPETARANQVLSVDPEAGSKVTLDTRITIYYASGKSKVPRVIDFPKDDAVAALSDAGFTKVKFEEEESTKTPGTVVRQTPEPYSTAKRTATITLWIAVAPPPPPSPTPTPTESATP